MPNCSPQSPSDHDDVPPLLLLGRLMAARFQVGAPLTGKDSVYQTLNHWPGDDGHSMVVQSPSRLILSLSSLVVA